MMINTYQGLEKAMFLAMSKILLELSDKIILKWKEHIQTNWYDKYDPVRYERFFAYLESITILDVNSNGKNKIEIIVGSDDRIMNQYHPSPLANLYDDGYGEDSGQFVRNMMENIGMTVVNSRGTFSRNPLESLEMIEAYYKKEKVKFFKKELRKYGFTEIAIK